MISPYLTRPPRTLEEYKAGKPMNAPVPEKAK